MHSSNKSLAEKVLNLKDKRGKPIINQTHAAILQTVGRFTNETGNYMSELVFLKNLPGKKICLKTLRNNLKYLFRIGVLERTLENGRLTIRLKDPMSETKEDMTTFRKRTGLYRYPSKKTHSKSESHNVGKNNILNNDGLENFSLVFGEDEQIKHTLEASQIKSSNSKEESQLGSSKVEKFSTNFNSKTRENFSPQYCGKVFPTNSGENFSPLTTKDKKITEELEEKRDLKTPPLTPPLGFLAGSLETELVKESGGSFEDEFMSKKNVKNQDQDQKHDVMDDFNLKGNGEGIVAQPLLGPKKRKKAHKTGQERLKEAVQDYGQGHITNPIGKPNTKGRMLCPTRARPIGESGAVTIAQLWKAYLEIFEHAFGNRDLLEKQMSGTRESLSSFFDMMRQKFLEYSGKSVDNRILYEYLVWFHDPKRVASMMAPNKGYVHPLQLMGAVSIKKFADQYVGVKKNELISEGVNKARVLTKFLTEAFDMIRDKHKDDFGMIQCLVSYGLVVVGEYLNDFHGMTDSQCKEKMISVMARFIQNSKNKEKAKEYIAKIWDSTKINRAIESTIWPQWEESCKNFVNLAIEKSERLPPDE